MNEIYKKLLEKFCDPNRSILEHYGNYGDKSYASNGYMAIETPQQIDGEEYPKTGKMIYDVFPAQTINHSFKVAELKEKLQLFSPIENTKPLECKACSGDGYVKFEFYFKGNTYDLEGECPICEGECIEKLNSFNSQPIIKIGNNKFHQSLVMDLLYIAKTLNAEIITLVNENEHKGSLFIIYEIRVLLMSTRSDNKIVATIEF